jgi:hypothetical protein
MEVYIFEIYVQYSAYFNTHEVHVVKKICLPLHTVVHDPEEYTTVGWVDF